MSEKYEPTEEEMRDAEGQQTEVHKNLSWDREHNMKGVNLELLKKCQLTISSDREYEYVKGTIQLDDRTTTEIELRRRPIDDTYMCHATVNGIELLDRDIAKSLWDKFAPIAQFVKYEDENASNERTPARITASRLLEL